MLQRLADACDAALEWRHSLIRRPSRDRSAPDACSSLLLPTSRCSEVRVPQSVCCACARPRMWDCRHLLVLRPAHRLRAERRMRLLRHLWRVRVHIRGVAFPVVESRCSAK